LLNDSSSWMTGQILHLDGGLSNLKIWPSKGIRVTYLLNTAWHANENLVGEKNGKRIGSRLNIVVIDAEEIKMNRTYKAAKLVLGDQLNHSHPWYRYVDMKWYS
jgi:hypothetical protein